MLTLILTVTKLWTIETTKARGKGPRSRLVARREAAATCANRGRTPTATRSRIWVAVVSLASTSTNIVIGETKGCSQCLTG